MSSAPQAVFCGWIFQQKQEFRRIAASRIPAAVIKKFHIIYQAAIDSAKRRVFGYDIKEKSSQPISRFERQKSIRRISRKIAIKRRFAPQKVIDVRKDKSKGFQVVLIKLIDRFTRGGGDYYSPLKRQLTLLGIALEDMYGVIGKQQINTLEHTGFKYYCLPEVWQNPFWQRFARQDGRVLSGIPLQS